MVQYMPLSKVHFPNHKCYMTETWMTRSRAKARSVYAFKTKGSAGNLAQEKCGMGCALSIII